MPEIYSIDKARIIIRADDVCGPDRLDPGSSSALSGLEIVNAFADDRLPRAANGRNAAFHGSPAFRRAGRAVRHS